MGDKKAFAFRDLMGENYQGNDKQLIRLYEKNRIYFEQIRNNVPVPMFGAGFTGGFYPSWSKLLIDLAEAELRPSAQATVKQRLAEKDYEGAASELCKQLGGDGFQFLEELSLTFGKTTWAAAEESLGEARRSIPRIFKGPILTTNVERVIEEVYRKQGKVLEPVIPHTAYQEPQAIEFIQKGTPGIFKLHGDVVDRTHMVFTKEQYDKVYGTTDEPSPLVKTMCQMFSSSQILFLGCSVERDRVFEVLKQCRENHSYYALVELPAETYNEEAPFVPRLGVGDMYYDRKQFMADHHINCIWYPHGQYEALDVFLLELDKKLNGGGADPLPAPPAPPTSAVPPSTRDIIGRETARERIEELLRGNKPVFVTGTGGLGKTEVCHLVLRKLERGGKSVRYIDMTNMKVPAELCKRLDDSVSDQEAADLQNCLNRLQAAASQWRDTVLYLDNWEDLWNELDRQTNTQFALLQWLSKVHRDGVPVLVSSRFSPDDQFQANAPFACFRLDSLAPEDAVKLFGEIYRPDPQGGLSMKGQDFDKLIEKLGGHPLAIILTAAQVRRFPSWEKLLAEWSKATQYCDANHLRHESLTAALKMTWDHLSKTPGCVLVWGLGALSREELPLDTLEKLLPPGEGWMEWVVRLENASVLSRSQQGTALYMLPPVKEGFFLLAEEELIIDCCDRWSRFFLPALEQARDWKGDKEKRKRAERYVLENRLQIIQLLERMVSGPWRDKLALLINSMTFGMLDYFQHSAPESLALTEKLAEFVKAEKEELLYAQLLRYRGDLFRLLSQYDKAQWEYEKAAGFCQTLGDDLGRANILRSLGDLCAHQGYYETAAGQYGKAEKLYLALEEGMGRNQGLANNLRSQGKLLVVQGDYPGAAEKYKKAVKWYLQVEDDLGYANTLLSLGELLWVLEKNGEARREYDKAERLYCKIESGLGCANTLRSRGRLDLSEGDTKSGIGQFRQALGLYEKLQMTRDIAYTCAFLSSALSDSEKLEERKEADELAQRTRTLAEQFPSTLRDDILSILE